MSFFSPPFCILNISLNPSIHGLGEYLLTDIRWVLLPFPCKTFRRSCQPFSKVLLYFSFLPAKQRDFPGNVRSGGCDSLPLVVAFTSKQHDSPLSYALHFLHIISHQMCCAGERAEGCPPPVCTELYLHLPLGGEREKKSARRAFSAEWVLVDCQGQQQVCFLVNPVPKKRRRITKNPEEPTLHLSLRHERRSLWFAVYFRRTLGPTVTCWNWSAAMSLTRSLTLITSLNKRRILNCFSCKSGVFAWF